jgi:integrase
VIVSQFTRVRKPRKDFPLFPHATGRWAKKVRGQFKYFGKVESDPKGEAALKQWLDQRDDLLAGRVPRVAGDGLTIRELINRFLTVKKSTIETREISNRHFYGLHAACELIIEHFGKNRLVDDLASDDFESLRASLAKSRGAWALSGLISKIRSVFKYGYEADLLDRPVRYGPSFKRPAKAALRRERREKPQRLFTADEIKRIIAAAGVQMKAMVLLGINCGLGNSDCGQLRFSNLDLKSGWLDYPRPKTGVERRAPLWKETIAALKAVIDERREPKDAAAREHVFITKYGSAWAQDREANPVSHEFRKLLISLELYQPGVSFYALRHCFRTVADATRDFPAIDLIMGHSDNSMASHYREQIDDDRLRTVADHVRRWLFSQKKRNPK